MRQIAFALLLACIAVWSAGERQAQAMPVDVQVSAVAQVNGGPVASSISLGCHRVWICRRSGCNWRRVCARICPDGVSCYPLYGAYGPYGGVEYWAGYTRSGWWGR